MVMRNRCDDKDNKSYPDYGGRGIKVCDRWRKFDDFYADMGPRPTPQHTIERIDNDGDYCPENCKWATRLEQGRNKRNNIIVHYAGRDMCLKEATELIGLSYKLAWKRLKNKGWSIERVLSNGAMK
jgi:hypothetical protein